MFGSQVQNYVQGKSIFVNKSRFLLCFHFVFVCWICIGTHGQYFQLQTKYALISKNDP